MNVLGRLEYLSNVVSAMERRGRSNDLVEDIVHALAVSGEYVKRVDLLPTEHVVDFRWAAHEAGRQLGIRIQVDVETAKTSPDGRALARVRPGVRQPDR